MPALKPKATMYVALRNDNLKFLVWIANRHMAFSECGANATHFTYKQELEETLTKIKKTIGDFDFTIIETKTQL